MRAFILSDEEGTISSAAIPAEDLEGEMELVPTEDQRLAGLRMTEVDIPELAAAAGGTGSSEVSRKGPAADDALFASIIEVLSNYELDVTKRELVRRD